MNYRNSLKAVTQMIVDLSKRNLALVSLFENPRQTIFLDANFLIPPDRTKVGAKPISFQKYREIWLDPVFDSFPNLAVHESVYGLPLQLIRKAEEFDTGLQDMKLLEMFDVIFYLRKMGKYDNNGLRLLYKYQYHLTKKEKLLNPEWGDFMKKMSLLYLE